MDKKYYCTFSISSKAAVYSRRLVHIITERIYGGFFVQLMVSCIFSSLFTLHVFLSKSVFPHSFFFLYISSPRNLFFLFSRYNDRSNFNHIRMMNAYSSKKIARRNIQIIPPPWRSRFTASWETLS